MDQRCTSPRKVELQRFVFRCIVSICSSEIHFSSSLAPKTSRFASQRGVVMYPSTFSGGPGPTASLQGGRRFGPRRGREIADDGVGTRSLLRGNRLAQRPGAALGTWSDRPHHSSSAARQPRTSHSKHWGGASKKRTASLEQCLLGFFFSSLNKASLALVSFFFFASLFYNFFFIFFRLAPLLYPLLSTHLVGCSSSCTPATPRKTIPSELILSDRPVCIHQPRHASLRTQLAIPSTNSPLSSFRIH
jgi:hypothetical protein